MARFRLAFFPRRLAVPQTEGIEGALFLSPRAGDDWRLGKGKIQRTINMANIMNKTTTSLLWLAGVILFALIWMHSGWKIAGIALPLIIAFIDLLIWFVASLTELPCAFTEWVCYPFWPFIQKGFSMFTGVIIRIVEIAVLIIWFAWLVKVVESLF